MSEELMTVLFNAFEPAQPLEANDPFYVDCRAVRGDDNIFRELGDNIIRSELSTCQLYTGHRGVGKTTELKRLQAYLEKKGSFVVYFGATVDDIDENDVQYTDILLACTRHILEQLKDDSVPQPLIDWLQNRWDHFQNLDLIEKESNQKFEELSPDAKIKMFAKLTATLRAAPNTRKIIREQVEMYMQPLSEALNNFLREAQKRLAEKGFKKLVVLVDNLDRIVKERDEQGNTNYDTIFIDHSQQLKSLDCHLVYTVPISLVHSNRSAELRDAYNTPQILPMIKIQDQQGKSYKPGLEKIKEIIAKRLQKADQSLEVDGGFFEDEATRLKLSLMSGGHVRELMLLVRTAMSHVDDLPLTTKAVQRAITVVRNDTYSLTVDQQDWEKLAKVYLSKKITNEEDYRDLLFRRCLMEYREETDKGEVIRWHDVHPLIQDLKEFQGALAKEKSALEKEGGERPPFGDNDLDDLITKAMGNLQEVYSEHLDKREYKEAAAVADRLVTMLQELLEEVKDDERNYRKITAIAVYWRFARDLYQTRSRSELG